MIANLSEGKLCFLLRILLIRGILVGSQLILVGVHKNCAEMQGPELLKVSLSYDNWLDCRASKSQFLAAYGYCYIFFHSGDKV